MKNREIGFYGRYVKRCLDFILSFVAIVLLSPVLLVTSILVAVKLGKPVIFTQKRPGLNGKIFTLKKFRSMNDKKDENGELLPDDIRLTPFGEKLRSTSLDELPELWNILKGDMSIVGPRPLLPYDVEYMTPEQKRRHNVRPGVTGLAQCSGRNNLNWDEKLALDVEYIENVSFINDVKIIFKTIGTVLSREGVEFEDGTDMDLKDWIEYKNNCNQNTREV